MVALMRRGEIWVARLNPNQGVEVGKLRPVVILQADPITQAGLATVIVVHLTTQNRLGARALRVPIRARDRLLCDSFAMADQPRSLDRSRQRQTGPLPCSTQTEAGLWGDRGRSARQSPGQPAHSPWCLGAAAPRWILPPVRQCSIQSQGQAAAQPLSAVAGCPWLTQRSISRTSCSKPIGHSSGTALAPAALLRFAAALRFLSLPRHAHVRRPRGQRLRASSSGYRLGALHNPRDGAGNPSRQFQLQQSRPAFAVCGRQISDASPACPGQLKTVAAACSGMAWWPLVWAGAGAAALGTIQNHHLGSAGLPMARFTSLPP